MAAYRMAEKPLPRELQVRARMGLAALACAAMAAAVVHYAPPGWFTAAFVLVIGAIALGSAYIRFLKWRARSLYVLDEIGARMQEPFAPPNWDLRWEEIVGYVDQPRGLVLLTAQRYRRLLLPAGLEDIEAARAELAQHGLGTMEEPGASGRKREIFAFAVFGAAAIVGTLQTYSRPIFAAAAIGGTVLALALAMRMRSATRQRWRAWVVLLLWLVALADGYCSHFHPNLSGPAFFSLVLINCIVVIAAVPLTLRRRHRPSKPRLST